MLLIKKGKFQIVFVKKKTPQLKRLLFKISNILVIILNFDLQLLHYFNFKYQIIRIDTSRKAFKINDFDL